MTPQKISSMGDSLENVIYGGAEGGVNIKWHGP